MEEAPHDLEKQVKEHSDILAKLGRELANMQFSYKVEEATSKEYWENRITNFKKYTEKGLEYYNQVYSIMNIMNKDDAQMFLLHISKFKQQSEALANVIEKIRENPSIINRKDRQQSRWSREIKNQIVQYSDDSLQHEKRMNAIFREFYDKYLKT